MPIPTLSETNEMAQKVRDWLATKHASEIGPTVTRPYSGTDIRVVEVQVRAVSETDLENFCDSIQPVIYHRVFSMVNRKRTTSTLTVWFFYDPRPKEEVPETIPEDYEEEDY